MREMQQVQGTEKSVRMTATFLGYNHRDVITDGEMYDTENLSDDQYPALTVRKKRGITSFEGNTQLTGIHGRDRLVYIRGNTVYYNGNAVTGEVSADPSMLPKKIASMGAYVCIWPDKKYFNTTDEEPALKGLDRMLEIASGDIKIQMCKIDGEAITVPSGRIKATAPSNPSNGMYWIDTSGTQHVLRQYTSATKEWVEIPTVYAKIYTEDDNGAEGPFINTGIKEYDTIEISGLKADSTASTTAQTQVEEMNGSRIVYGAGEAAGETTTTHYIIIVGMLDVANPTMDTTEGSKASFDRKIPELDFVIESNNRLWGCKYGKVGDQTLNEIYASKLGDPENWSSFMGLSTDSYTMSVGSDGPFTGAITQRGTPVFFKDQCIHVISGSSPSSYQLTTIRCRGVQEGSWRSLAILNETVYYKASTDVMAFDGNLPYIISDNLGDVRYSDARAGVVRNKYYLCMKDTENQWNLFVYDTRNGQWYREDDLQALGFATVGDELYAIDEENNTLVAMLGTSGTEEDNPPWKAEFGLSGVEYAPARNGMARNEIRGNHYMSRFDVRLQLEDGGKAEMEIEYDSNGIWEKKGEIY